MEKSIEVGKIFENEPAVLNIAEESIMIIGDIHGNLAALDAVLRHRKEKHITKILFLGDYVDRGTQGIEVLHKLYNLKIAEPNNIFLLRGNHEDKRMNKRYGFFEEIGKDHTVLELLDETFRKMPIATIVNEQLFCVHGGIPNAISIDILTKDNSFQCLWNDPMLENGIFRSRRGIGVYEFGPDITDAFLKINGLEAIIRSHTYIPEGYAILFDGKLISIFSCPNYHGDEGIGVYAIFTDGELSIHQVEIKE